MSAGFDHDTKVRDRAKEPVVIGGVTLHPAPQSWDAIRALKKASRVAARADGRRERLETRAAEIEESSDDDDAKVAEADKLYEQADEQHRQGLLATCGVVAAQLLDDKGKVPEAQFVFDHLDFHQLNGLISYLVGTVDDDEPDPT